MSSVICKAIYSIHKILLVLFSICRNIYTFREKVCENRIFILLSKSQKYILNISPIRLNFGYYICYLFWQCVKIMSTEFQHLEIKYNDRMGDVNTHSEYFNFYITPFVQNSLDIRHTFHNFEATIQNPWDG